MQDKPQLGFWQIWNISFGFLGIQVGFALQNANASRIFQTLGAPIDDLPILWLAGPVTGLLVQPIIGYFSDRTWGRLGRRRPYFLAGGILSALALVLLPNMPALWMAAITFWLLDSAFNVAVEPFRAFAGDMLPAEQRTRGYAMQGVFIGAGAVLGSIAPWVFTKLGVPNEAAAGIVPDSVRWSFYIGAAAFVLAICYTVFTTKEYSPQQLASFREPASLFRNDVVSKPTGPGTFSRWGGLLLLLGAAACAGIYFTKQAWQLYVLGGGLTALGLAFLLNAALLSANKGEQFFSHIMGDLTNMPTVMQRLAVVQLFSWFALFCMWIYTTPAVAAHHYGASGPEDRLFQDAGNWVGILFGTYNGVAAVYSFLSPWLAKKYGLRTAHAIALLCGAAGLASMFVIGQPKYLLLSMVGVGIAWSSILTLPYSMLCDALPKAKFGVFMGIFNFFIVLPQIVAAGLLGVVLKHGFGNQPILVLLLGGASLAVAAAAVFLVPTQARAPAKAAVPA